MSTNCWLSLLLVIFLAGVTVGALAIISIGISYEDRQTLRSRASNPMLLGVRKVSGLHVVRQRSTAGNVFPRQRRC